MHDSYNSLYFTEVPGGSFDVKAKAPLAVLLLLLAIFDVRVMAQQQEVAKGKIVAKNHVFANKLYQAIAEEQLSKGSYDNLIFSPLSLEIVLAAAGLGARGETQAQIAGGLGLPLELETMQPRYAPILYGMKNDSCILQVATQLFVEEDFPLTEGFVNSSIQGFSCGIQPVRFVAEPEKALFSVNDWAEKKTEGLIKNLLMRDDITVDTRLILTNAVYFKGKWAHPFQQSRTQKAKFNVGNGVQVDVDMMFVEKRFRYGRPDGLNAQVLELPYEGDKLSMVILLPDENSSLQELESKVSAEAFDLDGLLSNHTHLMEVSVYLPKFKLELKQDLEKPLLKLGMSDMFTDHADFSGITPSPQGLKVSKVVQKAFIEVSEEGTVAAAATGMVMVTRVAMIPRDRAVFRADRPFIFVLREKVTRINLFSGRFQRPKNN